MDEWVHFKCEADMFPTGDRGPQNLFPFVNLAEVKHVPIGLEIA